MWFCIFCSSYVPRGSACCYSFWFALSPMCNYINCVYTLWSLAHLQSQEKANRVFFDVQLRAVCREFSAGWRSSYLNDKTWHVCSERYKIQRLIRWKCRMFRIAYKNGDQQIGGYVVYKLNYNWLRCEWGLHGKFFYPVFLINLVWTLNGWCTPYSTVSFNCSLILKLVFITLSNFVRTRNNPFLYLDMHI